MQNFDLTLSSDVHDSFRCRKAANSLDINIDAKSVHHFQVEADLETDYNIGVIVGASGSGKSTLAQHIWGKHCFDTMLKTDLPVIDQFDKKYSYDDCARMLTGIGLSSVPCWIRPAYTLSNGQKCRAEIALQLSRTDRGVNAIDEWTSVVDRTVAKVMSHCIQKHARKMKKRIVLLTCHYDVLDWLNPDWVIDCNKQQYTDRRCLQRTFKRKEKLKFDIRDIGRRSWKYFAKYHYLTEKLPGGHIELFGLFHGHDQIGFQCFANYVPYRKAHKIRGIKKQMHSNRAVIHPDYCGFGLSMKMINATSQIMFDRGYDVRAKCSSIPIIKLRQRETCWQTINVERNHKVVFGVNMTRDSGFRMDVTTYSFKFIGFHGEAA